jgi:hypothetical protein
VPPYGAGLEPPYKHTQVVFMTCTRCTTGLVLAALVVGDGTPASEMLKPGELPGDSVIPIINITYRVGS